MSGQIDVLAVLDAEIACKRIAVANGYSSEEVLNETEETRDAVAELIDKVDSTLALGWSDTAARELRAARARIGGTK